MVVTLDRGNDNIIWEFRNRKSIERQQSQRFT